MLRNKILKIVKKWEKSELSEIEVHGIAEDLVEQIDSIGVKESADPIAFEVLFQLDIMNHQLITKEDIPMLLEILNTKKRDEVQNWKKWKNYWENIDYNKRKIQLSSNPFYFV